MAMNNQTHSLLKGMLANVVRMLRSAGLLSGYMAGRLASDLVARLCSIVILAVLGVNLFLFLNIALGFWLGSLWGGSPAQGFFLLSGIYLLLILSYLCLRSLFEGKVRDAVANKSADIAERSVQKLEVVGEDEVLVPSVPTFLRRPVTYAELSRRVEVEQKNLAEHVDTVRFDALYLKDNYKGVATEMVTEKVTAKYPKLSYLMPVWGLIRGKKRASLQSEQPSGRVASEAYVRRVSTLAPYMPIVKLLAGIARPVLWSFLVARGQNILASLLGMKKWKRGK